MSHRQRKVVLATPGRFDVIRPSQFCREACARPFAPAPVGLDKIGAREGTPTGTYTGTKATQRCDSRSCQNNMPRAVRCRSTGKNIPSATAAAAPIFSISRRWRCDTGAREKCSNSYSGGGSRLRSRDVAHLGVAPKARPARRLDRGATREPRGPKTRANHWAGNRGVVETICESHLVTAMDCRNCRRLKAKKARPMAATAKNWGQTVSNPAPRKMMACEKATK